MHGHLPGSFDGEKTQIQEPRNPLAMSMPSSRIMLEKYLSCSFCFYQLTELGNRNNKIYVFSHSEGLEAPSTSSEGLVTGHRPLRSAVRDLADVWQRSGGVRSFPRLQLSAPLLQPRLQSCPAPCPQTRQHPVTATSPLVTRDTRTPATFACLCLRICVLHA